MTIRHALRSLRRTPGFVITMILTLVLGIGSVGAMFAIVYGVLLAPLPYGEPERLVSITLQAAEQTQVNQTPAHYFTYQRYARQLGAVALYRTGSSNIRSNGGTADSVVATWISASMLPLLQVPPLLGRSFSKEEEIRGGPNAVILSESEWRTRFDSAPDIIGKTLIVNDAAREIVGVMPAAFSFPTAATRVWLPVKYTDSPTVGDFLYSAVARLVPGATAEQAQAELSAILPRMAQAYPQLQSGASTATWLAEQQATPTVLPLRDELTNGIAQTLWLLAAAAGLVLLVAWANVVNLMLVRADASQLELAVRQSLGASRLRIATHAFSESVVLGLIAGVLALLFAYCAVRALVAFGPPDIPRLAELGVGWATTAFITLVTIVGVLIAALLPNLRFRLGSLANKLHDGARGHSSGKARQRVRAAICVLQIAMALVATVGSALLLRTAHNLYQVRPGFDANAVMTLRTLLPLASYDDGDRVAFHARLTERVAQLPSVRAVGVAMQLPLSGEPELHQNFAIGGGRTRSLPVNVIGNGYFAAMNIPLLAGRDFRPLERELGGNIVISQRAAATLFGDATGVDAVGKQLTLAPNGPSYTIVGVVGDVRNEDLGKPASALIYRPQALPINANIEPRPQVSMALVLRTSGSVAAIMPAIRKIVRELDPAVPIYEVKSMQEVVRASTARLSFALTLITVAALITLVLGAIGLYGVIAYRVALRAREFGVRIALGAAPRRVAVSAAMHGIRLAALGVMVGFAFYALAAPFLRAFLFGVSSSDPLTLTVAALVLLGAATLASVIPARRAGIDPAQALRAE